MDCIDFLGGGTLGNLTSGSSHLWTSFGATMANAMHAQLKEEKDYSPRSAASGADAHFDLNKALQAVRIERKDVPSPESYGGPCWDFGWRTSFKDCNPKQLQMIYKINGRYMKIFEKLGYEIPEDMVPIVRAPYQSRLGGIIINRDQESNLPGLLAAGETAGKINYFQSGGVSSAMTSGTIAGTVAARRAEKMGEPFVIQEQVETLKAAIYAPMERKDGLSPFKLRNKIVDALCLSILEKGFLVNEASLQRAVDGMEKLKKEDLPHVAARDSHELMKANEVRNMLEVFPIQIRASMLRKESRFLPREDYPYWDDKNWKKYIDLKLKEDGEIEFWTTDIPKKKEPVKA
jgi:succinate dehydrogenase/fumarate reductase flavoprotein subunit